MAAMAKVESSSSASIAPLAAMMAETPQIDDPTARRLVSFGVSPNTRAEKMHQEQGERNFDDDESEADSAKLQNVSDDKARAEQNDANFEPKFVRRDAGLEDFGTLSRFEMTRPMTIAHRTYSMLGNVQ